MQPTGCYQHIVSTSSTQCHQHIFNTLSAHLHQSVIRTSSKQYHQYIFNTVSSAHLQHSVMGISSRIILQYNTYCEIKYMGMCKSAQLVFIATGDMHNHKTILYHSITIAAHTNVIERKQKTMFYCTITVPSHTNDTEQIHVMKIFSTRELLICDMLPLTEEK